MTTAAELVNRAFYLSNVLDPEEETPGSYADRGLSVLNGIIDTWGSLSIYIPSSAIQTISTVIGTYQYSIAPIVTEFLQGNLLDSSNVQSILYEADLKQQNTFNYNLSLGSPTRPSYVFFQNDQLVAGAIQNDTTVFLYPVPDKIYTVNLTVKNRLPHYTYSEDIVNVPLFYERPLEYQMALELSVIYTSVLPARFDEEYERVMKNLKSANKKDTSVSNSNPLKTSRRFRPWGSYVG